MTLDTSMLAESWVDRKYKDFQEHFPRVSPGFTRNDFKQMVILMLCHSSAAVEQEYLLADKTVKKIHTLLIGGERLKVTAQG